MSRSEYREEYAELIRATDYFSDACYQALVYWIMSALTNDPFKLARYAGLYKAVQSAGSAGSYGMDAVATPFLNELVRSLDQILRRFVAHGTSAQLASWIMMLASLPLALMVIYTIKETNYGDEKVRGLRLSSAPSAPD